jgi:RNA 2',3'-cyclic 3'-phosphodiesterase
MTGAGGGRRGHDRYQPAPEDPTRPRLFFAVPVPEETRARISALRDAVQASVGDGRARIRWVRMDSLHVTLRFLGPTSLDEAPALATTADAALAGLAPFEVAIAGAGAFPERGWPRTLWLGIRDGATELAAIAATLATALPKPEAGNGKPFAPHLTIARTDGLRVAGDAASALTNQAADLRLPFVADRVVLYRSHLGDGPAHYEPIHETALDS